MDSCMVFFLMGFNAPRISIQVHQLLTYNYDWCNNLGEIRLKSGNCDGFCINHNQRHIQGVSALHP